MVALAGFIAVEQRVPEPLLPLELFRNRIFTIACAIGFIVGLALFGSITFMPLYLQVAKGASPTHAGLTLTPMMAGVLVTSVGSGRLISRIGRYRPFPIAGTALTTLGLALMATLGVESSVRAAIIYMIILGLGLGLIMQVLVLAVQNAVDYQHLGVATSCATLFRSIGGSIGVSLFGAIFAANLAANLAGALPAGTPLPSATAPAAIRALPGTTRALYLDAFTTALHPVFVYGAVIAAVAFVLTWFLKEIPLRAARQMPPNPE
jgi:MFS family permease